MIGYAIILITMFSNGQVRDVVPVEPVVYKTMFECEQALKFKKYELPPLSANQEIKCAETEIRK